MKLINFLESYNSHDIYPFHMPGHKRNPEFMNVFATNALGFDITEIPGADNLHEPSGPLLELKHNLASLYGADESFLLINGSSCGVIAAIMAVCGEGDSVLVARNSHRSVFSGLIMSGAAPVYVCPQVDADGFCKGIEPDDIKHILKADSGIKAVVITSPTYEGSCSEIVGIADAVHEAGAVLIVDEAHGAHFGFHDYFPEASVRLGADIVIHSLHKTMPALTQTAVLHIKSNRVDRGLIAEALAMVQSSSPSYILMAAAEIFIDKFGKDSRKHFDNFIELLYPLRKELKTASSLRLSEPGKIYDRSKLLLLCGEGCDGGFLIRELRNRYGIELEMARRSHVLAMTGVADTKDGFDRLSNALRIIDKELAPYTAQANTPAYVTDGIQELSPRKAFHSKRASIAYMHSVGMISAGIVVPYPPGVPVLAPGELVTSGIIDIINDALLNGVTVSGVDKGKIAVVID